MKDHSSTEAGTDRFPRSAHLWEKWLGNDRKPAFAGTTFEPSGQAGVELLSVAHATMTWWEKHRNDTVTIQGETSFRYEFKPRFVTHAQEVIKKAQARN